VVVAFAYEPPALGAEVADHRRLPEERGKALTDEALASLGGAGVEATAAVVGACPVEALLNLADERQARIIVVGTGGEPPLMGVVLGGRPTGSCTARPCPSWWFLPPPEPSIHKMVGER